MKKCGITPRTHDVQTHRRADGSTFISGLYSCGSGYSCPTCAHRIGTVQTLQDQAVLETWMAQGGGVLLWTPTPLDHWDWSQDGQLSDALDATTSILKKIRTGRPWERVKTAFQIQGFLQRTEVMAGRGSVRWLPHQHLVLLTRRPLTEEQRRALLIALDRRWVGLWSEQGVEVPEDDFDEVLKLASGDDAPRRIGSYVNKGWDSTYGARHPKTNSFTPWQIAEEAARLDPRAIAMWQEFQRALKGRPLCVRTPGLLKRLGVPEFRVEVAESESLVRLGAEGYAALRAIGTDAAAEALQVLQESGWEAYSAHLTALGVPHVLDLGTVPTEDVSTQQEPAQSVQAANAGAVAKLSIPMVALVMVPVGGLVATGPGTWTQIEQVRVGSDGQPRGPPVAPSNYPGGWRNYS